MTSAYPGWTLKDIVLHPLEGEPPPGFDCGRNEQNDFLYGLARRYHEADLGLTYLAFIKGIFAGYITVANDSITLGTRERGKGIPHPNVPALKLAQLGVDLRFQGSGLGRALVGIAVSLAVQTRGIAGCRYLTLDAQPDLLRWYESQGFVRNKQTQNERMRRALERGVDPDTLPVSMRLDLRAA